MIQARGFSGKLNQDDSPFRLPAGDYTDALNITRDAQGAGNDEIITNVPGNEVVNYAFEAGTNKVIGNYADKVRNRQYIFVWNSTGYHEITYYDANLGTIVKVIKNLTDTGGVDVLKFDPSWKINHIDIIYRDEEGDLLYWTDGLNPPRKVNVKTATLGNYGVVISSYLDVAKEPPSAPPYCVYENDATVTVNNLNNKQFKFKYRFVFDDLEKSVTSAQSEIPIPWEYTLPAIYNDPTKNSLIFLVFQTGAENVTKIELLAAQSQGVTFSDYFLIQVIDKAELGLNSNDVATFKFYNYQSYNIIPIKESIQPFDLVPLRAYTQSLPNGNVLDYGAITEGYNVIEPDYETTLLTSIPATENNNYLLAVAYQSDQPAFGSGDIKIIIGGNPQAGDVININVLVGVTPYTITATAANPETIAGMITKLSASAVLGGFTVVSSTANELVINQVNSTIVKTGIVYSPYVPSTASSNSIFAYDWGSKYAYGVVYFDEKGRTNGVVTSLPCAFQTKAYTEVYNSTYQLYIPDLPTQQLEINSRPPEWAYYFQIVRTTNLTKSNFLYWISDRTYKDTVPNQAGYQYAYVGLATLTQYIVDNPEAKTLGYEFTVGDRIRFIKLYNSAGGTAQVYTSNDYQIIASLTNPVINGVTISGQVLKLNLPPTNANFDFGGDTYANYLVEIYTPALNYSNEVNLYYEFGERYIVGNPGTNTAYHQGMTQNQTSNLSVPALYKFFKGDSYFRFRLYQRGGYVKYNFAPTASISASGSFWYLGSQIVTNTINDPGLTFADSVSQGSLSTSNYTVFKTSNLTSYTLRIKGFIKIKPSAALPNPRLNVIVYDSTTPATLSTPISYFGPLLNGVEYRFEFNSAFQINLLYQYIFLQVSLFSGDIISGEFTIQKENDSIYQGIIDPNFADTYDSSATPNGRAWKVEPNALQVFNPALIRFGDEFQPGTTINNTNRFYEDNFDVYDRSKGGIKKMFIEGRNQYIFQQFDVGVVTILTQIVRDTAGNPLSAQSDKLLNKIVYPYQGGYGIGEFPESFAYGKNAKYFIDGNKGVVVRLAQNGMTPISIVYKMNAFFVPRIAKYKDAFVPTTGKSTIYGAFDAYTNKYIIAMEEVYDSTPAVIQDAKTIAFLETATNKEGFESFLSFLPENMGALNNQFFSFKAGQIWKHLTPDPISGTPAFCNFYNTQYSAEVQVVFNEAPMMKKYFLSIMESANTAWECPAIQSQLESYAGTPQLTAIVSARFKLLEGQYYSAIFRDINSKGGLINGAIMHGNYLIVRFKKDQASSFVYLNAVSLNYKESPLNIR